MGRAVALDPGTRRIGVAVSDSSRTLASPRASIANDDHAVDEIVRLVTEESADLVLVGLARTLEGGESDSTEMSTSFAALVAQRLTGVEVRSVDERFTSVMAASRLREVGRSARQQRELVDSAAAAILLQGYLDAHAR